MKQWSLDARSEGQPWPPRFKEHSFQAARGCLACSRNANVLTRPPPVGQDAPITSQKVLDGCPQSELASPVESINSCQVRSLRDRDDYVLIRASCNATFIKFVLL
jgi:hypothetical protein